MPADPDDTSADRSVMRAPALARIWTNWTTDDLDVAESLTGNGNLQRAADLCWALLGDGRVRAALETRVKGLLRLPLSWEVGKGPHAAACLAALEGGDFYAAHSEAALASLYSWGVLLGVGIAQRVWQEREGRLIGVLQPYDARHLRWDPIARLWRVRTESGDVSILPGDRRWVLYAPSCSGAPTGDERPWMYGAWRACARPWLGKYFAWGDWQHHAELHGSPIRTADIDVGPGITPPNATQRTALANDLADIGGNTSLVPVPGAKLRLLEATAKTWEMFPASINAASIETVISITGQSSSTEIAKGQDTGATLHGKVRQDLIDGDAQTSTTCIHDQSLGDYAALNFGDAEAAPWPKYKTEPPADARARGEAMLALGDGIAKLELVAPQGKGIDRLAIFEGAGIPLVDVAVKPTTGQVFAWSLETGTVTRDEARAILYGLPPLPNGSGSMPLGETETTVEPSPEGDQPLAGFRSKAASIQGATPDEAVAYADKITEALRRVLVGGSKDRVADVVKAVRASTGQADLKARLTTILSAEPDEVLMRTIAKARVLARLAGRVSAQPKG